jgi:hypothetical protein
MGGTLAVKGYHREIAQDGEDKQRAYDERNRLPIRQTAAKKFDVSGHLHHLQRVDVDALTHNMLRSERQARAVARRRYPRLPQLSRGVTVFIDSRVRFVAHADDAPARI